MKVMKESLTKVVHGLEFASDDLREALNNSIKLESIIILNLIETNAKLLNDVKQLLSAIDN